MAEIRVTNVRKKFGDVTALNEVSLFIPDGMIVAVVGPSGSGKTTLLRIIAGLETPDSGKVIFNGRDVTQLPSSIRNVGMVFQDLALFPHMTVLENVMFGLEARGLSRSESIRIAEEFIDILKLKGLENRYPHQLSGGQQQRVAIARALAPDPDILLLDEPFGSLDAKLKEELLWEIKRLWVERRFTALHVTHDQAEAMSLAERLAVMRDGKIVREGSVNEVITDPKDEFVARFLGANIIELEERDRGLYSLENFSIRYEPGLQAIRVGFYPEDVEFGLGIKVKVIASSRYRSGYRVMVRDKRGSQFELWLPSIPQRSFDIRPKRWFMVK